MRHPSGSWTLKPIVAMRKCWSCFAGACAVGVSVCAVGISTLPFLCSSALPASRSKQARFQSLFAVRSLLVRIVAQCWTAVSTFAATIPLLSLSSNMNNTFVVGGVAAYDVRVRTTVWSASVIVVAVCETAGWEVLTRCNSPKRPALSSSRPGLARSPLCAGCCCGGRSGRSIGVCGIEASPQSFQHCCCTSTPACALAFDQSGSEQVSARNLSFVY